MSEESAALWYSSDDGLSLLCRRLDGPTRRAPLLCIHDIAQTSRIFRPLAREISVTRRIMIPDLRGHGRSDYAIDLDAYTIDRIANDVGRLLDTLQVTLCAVIGCGIGGLVALQLAARRPNNISAIVLCESGPDLSRAELRQDIVRAEAAVALRNWDAAEHLLRGARLILRDHGGRPVCDWDPFAAQRLVESLKPKIAWQLFDAVKAKPMMAMRAANSRAIDAAGFDAMPAHKGDLILKTIEGPTDIRQLDQARAIEAVRAFLAGVP